MTIKTKQTKISETISETLVKCPQIKCGFLDSGLCRNCCECNCKPNYIDENCDRCLKCAREENVLRWEVDIITPVTEEEKAQLIKILSQLEEEKTKEEKEKEKKKEPQLNKEKKIENPIYIG